MTPPHLNYDTVDPQLSLAALAGPLQRQCRPSEPRRPLQPVERIGHLPAVAAEPDGVPGQAVAPPPSPAPPDTARRPSS